MAELPGAATVRGLIGSTYRDLCYAARTLRRDPRFSISVVVTLALAMGAVTAVYSAVRAIVLEPLPYEDSRALTAVWSNWPEQNVKRVTISGGDFRTFQREARSFGSIAAVGSVIQNLTGGVRPEQVTVGWVSRNFFSLMKVPPILGRDFQPGEPPNSLVLGYGIWQQAFGADGEIVGKTVQLDGVPFVVIGVLAPGFRLHLAADAGIATNIDVWRPPDETGSPARWVVHDLQSSMLRLVGRLRPGTSIDQARQEMQGLARRLREQFPDHAAARYEVAVEPLHEEVVGHLRPTFLVLQVAVLLVLLLACANVANLLLARAQGRRAEISMRLMLGAARGTIFRQLITESAVMAGLGGALGVLLARVGLWLLKGLRFPDIPRLDTVGIHSSSLAFALAVMLGATLLFGVWPALRASRLKIANDLNVRGGKAMGLKDSLVVAEVTLAMMLLAGSGIVLRSFMEMQRTDPGFVIEDLLTFGISLPGNRYESPLETSAFIDELERRLEARSWALSAGATWPLPLEGQLWAGDYETVVTAGADPRPIADYRLASPGLLVTLGLRLVEGRDLAEDDTIGVLVDEELARRNWPERSAIGQWIRFESGLQEMRVVGVVENVRHPRLRTYSAEAVYIPARAASWSDWEIFVVVRTVGDPARFITEARQVLHSLDPELPMGKVRTMESYLADRLAPNRFASLTTAFFSLAALALAVVGLYGLLSYAVARRRYEIGVRMAVGATPVGILGLVLRKGLILTATGALLGGAGGVAGAGALSSLVYGIGPRDPLTFVGASAVILIAGLAAAWLPARRAAQTDLVELLRQT